MEKLLEGANGRVMQYEPTEIYYMNTIQCNQKCSKCSHWKRRDTAERLPVEKIITGLLSIPTAREFCIVGGEPLLFKSEIYEILKGISDSPIRTVIITNGVLMDREFVDSVSEFNIHIVVSIDTLDREMWKFVRGHDSRDRVLRNFEYAVTVLRSDQISIQSVRSKDTEPYLTEVAEYARSKNVYHSIQDYIQEGFDGSWEPCEEMSAYVPDKGQQCFAAGRNLSIVQNGDVYTCFQQSSIEGCERPLGNLKTHTIHEILSSDYVAMVHMKMKDCNAPCKVLKCNVRDR